MRASQTVTLIVEFDPERHDHPADWNWPEVIDGPVTLIKASPVHYLRDNDDTED